MTLKQALIFVMLLTVIFGFSIIPVLAQQGTAGPSSSNPSVSVSGALKNPLGDTNNDPRAIIGNIIRAALGLVGSLALAVFIYGGITWVTSGGNQERITRGKNMLIWATLGLAVVFASYAVVTFIIDALLSSAAN